MALSSSVINEFVDLTKDNTASTGQYAYGTAIVNGDYKYVQVDGSGVATALSIGTDVANGDRIMVYIENHTATVVANMTCPSSGRTATDVSSDLDAAFNYIEANYLSVYSASLTYASIENLTALYEVVDTIRATYITVDELRATVAEIDNLLVDYAKIDYVDANYASIARMDVAEANINDLEAEIIETNSLFANYATIEQLEARDVYISNLYADYADITNLLAGNIAASNLGAIVLTTENFVTDGAVITDAMIVDLTADKITAGTIYTARVKIQTDEGDSSLYLGDSLIQMSDSSIVRVQIGKDASGVYNFYIFNEDGDLMWDALGVTTEGIGNEVIVDTHVADNANIAGYKLDIDSVVSCINDNGNIQVDGSHVTINGDTLNYQLDTIIEEIANIELDTEGLKWFTPYYAINDSDTEPPLGNDEIYPAYADEAIADYSFADIYDTDVFWTTEELQPSNGQYLWMKFYLEYSNGDTGWSDPICLTDGYVRKITTTLQTELEVVQGQITAKVWQTDIDQLGIDVGTRITNLSSELKIDLDSITTEVKKVETDFNDFLTEDFSKIEQTINSISLSVSSSEYGSASIILSVDGENVADDSEFVTNAREAFAYEDNTSVTIQGGRIYFDSNTLMINSTNFQLDEEGNATMNNATATNLYISGNSELVDVTVKGDSSFFGKLEVTELTLMKDDENPSDAYFNFGSYDDNDAQIQTLEFGFYTGYYNDIWSNVSVTNDGIYFTSDYIDGNGNISDNANFSINPLGINFGKTGKNVADLGYAFNFEGYNIGNNPVVKISNFTSDSDSKMQVESWSGTKVYFGVGSGGYNRGVYDVTGNKWLVYADSSNDPHLGASTIGSSGQPIYLNSGKPTACTMSSIVRVSSISKDNVSVSSGSYEDITISSSLSGYTPIGIAGWNIANGSSNGANSSKCSLGKLYNSSTTVTARIINAASSAAVVSITIYVLYRYST